MVIDDISGYLKYGVEYFKIHDNHLIAMLVRNNIPKEYIIEGMLKAGWDKARVDTAFNFIDNYKINKNNNKKVLCADEVVDTLNIIICLSRQCSLISIFGSEDSGFSCMVLYRETEIYSMKPTLRETVLSVYNKIFS